MSERLSSNEVDNLAIQSLALSNALIEKLELMIENNLFAYKSKQSVKNTIVHLTAYINKVFNASNYNKEDLTLWSDIVLTLQNRIDKSLSNEEIIIISDRKALLRKILEDNINRDSIGYSSIEQVVNDIMKKVGETEILKF